MQVFILQMTGRPGFQRFLMRLNHWAIKYKAFEVSEEVYNNAHVSTPREEFSVSYTVAEQGTFRKSKKSPSRLN